MCNDAKKTVEMRSNLWTNGVGDRVDQSVAGPETVLECRLMALSQDGGVGLLDSPLSV